MSIEALVPSFQKRLKVTTSDRSDGGQICLRVGDIEAIQPRGPPYTLPFWSVKEGVGVTGAVPEAKFTNKLVPLGPGSDGRGGCGVLFTFSEVEVASEYSKEGVEVGEGLPEKANLEDHEFIGGGGEETDVE